MTEVNFQWNSGGNDVKIAGSFNNWVPTQMIKSGEKWIYRTKLDSGVHTYKFIADGNWYYDSKLPSLKDKDGVINNVMVIDNGNYKAISLISITNNNLELKNIINNIQAYKDDNIKVVSILGSARMGKSTLLNTIISKYNNYNNNVFATSKSATNHCTNGIDFVYVPGLKIVFCDVQGLNHDNSSNDPKLLLITYLMSDIIIFTEPKMLNKNTLQTLSPLASFLTYLDGQQIDSNNSKPSLVFRISDFTLEGKPEDNLNKLLVENHDQHKNVIINMKKLFKDIKAFKTEQLDRTEIKMLDANNFIGLLESDENGFNNFISELNDYLDKIPVKFNFENWYNNLEKFIKEINNNNKIDFNKLDLYHQIAKVELLEYKDNLRNFKLELFTEMKVNHSQMDLVNIINKRINQRDAIQIEFDTKFKVVNDNIKKFHYDEIMKEINKHIKEASDSNYEQAMNIMTEYTKTNFKRVDIKELSLYAGDLDLTESHNFLKSMDINENVENDYNKWKAQINDNYKKKKIVIIDMQKVEIEKYYNKMKNYLDNFINSVKESVLLNKTKNMEEINKFLLTSYETFKEELISKHTSVIDAFKTGLLQYTLSIDINKSSNNFKDFDIFFEVTTSDIDENYKPIKEIYDSNKETLLELINSNDIKKFFIIKKKQLLNNHKYYNPKDQDVQFSSDIARVNLKIYEFCNINTDTSTMLFLPLSQIKKKIMLKHTCNELVKRKLILKTNRGIIYNGKKYGSNKELFIDIFYSKHVTINRTRLIELNYYENMSESKSIFLNYTKELNIMKNNYKALSLNKKNKKIKITKKKNMKKGKKEPIQVKNIEQKETISTPSTSNQNSEQNTFNFSPIQNLINLMKSKKQSDNKTYSDFAFNMDSMV